MRLNEDEIAAIKAAAHEAFGETAIVRLFGSRVDDALEGGDVDLHVEADASPDIQDRRWAMLRALWYALPYDKIDLLISERGGGRPRGFERIAYRDGLLL